MPVKRLYILLLFFCALSIRLSAQIKTIDSLLQYKQVDKAALVLEGFESSQTNKNVLLNIQVLFRMYEKEMNTASVYLKKIDSTALSGIDRAYYNKSLGKSYSYANQEDLAYRNLTIAQKLFKESNAPIQANRLNYELHYIISSQEHLAIENKNLLNTLLTNSQQLNDPIGELLARIGLAAAKFDATHKKEFFSQMNKAKAIARRIGDSSRVELYHSYLGLYYSNFTTQQDSAIYHFDKSLQLSELYGTSDDLFYAHLNRATVPRSNENFKEAITYMRRADKIGIKQFKINNKRNLYNYLASDYKNIAALDSALYYKELYVQYTDSAQIESQNKNLTLYRTRELELENELEKKKRLLNRSLLIATLLALIAIALTAIFLIKNQRKKRLLTERENEILLRNQELSSIDAMVEGQAKERQRIAEDLHDNLGGLLATLKLYMENLKIKKNRLEEEQETLIKKTDDILELAYQKVRSIAHERNSGNPISLGLLPAIKEYAAQVSGANQLVIEVFSHGEDTRIGNAVELTLFRIIQELITNTIKHAFAKAVTIDLTYFEDKINLVYEDDGKGFDPEKTSLKTDGMGLSSIERRIKALDGNLTIDAKEGRGTSIIINIPIV